jgi:hypothetical protein
MSRRWLTVFVVLTLGALPTCGVARAENVVATTDLPTPIRSYGGVAAFSIYDSAAGVYRLGISRNGGPPELLAVKGNPAPFDVDVGPNVEGLPMIVYSRCTTYTLTRRRGCDLYQYAYLPGMEIPITSANARHASEIAPTIWHGRLAWARLSDRKRTRRPAIYTRRLILPPSIPSRRLSRFRPRDCGRDGCSIDEVELMGQRLAVLYRHPGPVCGSGRIVLGPLFERPIRIADTTCGLNGQAFAGLSFDSRNLYFAHFCVAEPSGCGQRTGVFRYSLRTRRYSIAPFGLRLTGFSYDGDGRAFEVLAQDTPRGYCGNSVADAPQPGPVPLCQIVLTDRLGFARTRPPR